MMTFINDDGEVLEVEGDIFLTKRAVSFFNSKILGDYSVNFNVDNNSQTRKVLNYDGPQMLNQVAFTRQPFTLMRNGNPFVRGNIIIQQDNGTTLSCFFLSGNSNWINLLNNLITELDFTGITNGTNYEFQWNKTNVLAKMSSTSGVVFPMVDWCYSLNKGNNTWYVANLLDGLKDTNQTYCEFYPCFYVKTLIQEIATQAGIKIIGTLMDDALYNSLALTPAAGEMKRERVNATTASGSGVQTLTLLDPAGYNKYTLFVRTSDPENLFSSSQYTAGRSSKLIITINLVSVSGTGTGPAAQLAIMKNGAPIYEEVITVTPSSVGIRNTITTVVQGDIISMSFKLLIGSPTTLTFGIHANIKIEIPTILTVDDFVRPNYFLPPLTQFDLLKFIINYFGCVCSFDDYSKTLSINVIEKMVLQNADDWSEYFVAFRSNYIIEPGANNYVRLQESEEYELKGYDKSNVIKFGEGSIPTNNQLKEQNDLLILPFSASWFQLAKNSDWLTQIPLVNLQDMDPLSYTSIIDIGGPTATYKYPYPSPDDGTGYVFAQGQVIRIVDDIRGDLGIHVVKTFTGGAVEFWGVPFSGNSTGRLYPQQRSFNEITPRILSVVPNVAFSDISTDETSYELFSGMSAVTTETAIASGVFCKNETGQPIDFIKTNLAFDNPAINGFTDPSIKNVYFGKIARMLNSPTITVTFILPESVFQAFAFDRFISIKTPKLSGYFFVKSIFNYKDSNSPVDVELYML